VMDDVGSLFWRLGRRMIVSSADGADEQGPDHGASADQKAHKPPSMMSPAAE